MHRPNGPWVHTSCQCTVPFPRMFAIQPAIQVRVSRCLFRGVGTGMPAIIIYVAVKLPCAAYYARVVIRHWLYECPLWMRHCVFIYPFYSATIANCKHSTRANPRMSSAAQIWNSACLSRIRSLVECAHYLQHCFVNRSMTNRYR